MKTAALLSALVIGSLVSSASAQEPVEYVRVCDAYGAGYHYIPGTETCLNTHTGDARQETEGGVWRSLLPYPEGAWVSRLRRECPRGRVVPVGTFESTDFTLNAWTKKQTAPISFPIGENQFISKVFMRGGFYDPRIPNRSGTNGTLGLCLRSMDPTVIEDREGGPYNPPFGNNGLPIGCVANSRIVNMPSTYAITATAAYPSITTFFKDAAQTIVSGPYRYGTQLVVTTDLGPNELTYYDLPADEIKPMAGSLTVSVCVQSSL